MLKVDGILSNSPAFQANPTCTKFYIEKMKRLTTDFGGFEREKKIAQQVAENTKNSTKTIVEEVNKTLNIGRAISSYKMAEEKAVRMNLE